jgi:hypothetical protein
MRFRGCHEKNVLSRYPFDVAMYNIVPVDKDQCLSDIVELFYTSHQEYSQVDE